MTHDVTRRRFLGATATGIGAVGLASMMPYGLREAHARTALKGVQWGGPWVEGARAVTAKQDQVDISWELHTGGAAAIIPKIKAAWPNPLYDFVAQIDALYYTWRAEGWAEPLTVADIPNLADVPDESLVKDDQGRALNVPLSHSGVFFGYRKDITPFAIEKMEDLLDPRLRGKILIRDAVSGLNNNTVQFALAFGGDERNLDPGWDFVKKLAQSGNIGRVGKSEVDFINSLTTGECAVGFWNIAGWAKVAENFPCEFLIKDRAVAPGFQAGMLSEGYLIPRNSPNKEAAKAYLNHCLSPEMNTLYNSFLNMAPANPKSSPTKIAEVITFRTKEDRAKYSYQFDWQYLASQREAMIRRFEQEVVPLIR